VAVKKLSLLAIGPGMLIWPLFLAGILTKNETLIGAGVVLFLLTAILVITLKVRESNAERARARQIWTQGLAGRAKVVTISSKGGGINDHPLVDLELDVTVDGKPTYRATTKAIISQLAIPRIQPACEIAVRVDPQDPQGVVVDPALTMHGSY
jgi:hypothetical protein